MNATRPLFAMILAATLGLAQAAAAAPVVQASCTVDGKQADLSLDPTGAGHLQASNGNASYSCELQLALIEGPPFSESAAGMLSLEFDEAVCTPAEAKRGVQRDVFLHIIDAQLPSREGMAVIERRSAVYQCQIPTLDMAGLKALQAQRAAKPAASGN